LIFSLQELAWVPFELVANAPLPMYTKCTNATWKVNEYHMQIDFILRKSGFLDLQERGIKWNKSTGESPTPQFSTPTFLS
jgi:hypothetical protein